MRHDEDPRFEPLVARFPNRVDAGFYIDIPLGWETLVFQLDEKLARIDPEYLILQIKEKFGGLRYYTSHAHSQECGGLNTEDSIRDCLFFRAIDHAESVAERTCEKCGKPGQLRKASSGWLHTTCEEHAPNGST